MLVFYMQAYRSLGKILSTAPALRSKSGRRRQQKRSHSWKKYTNSKILATKWTEVDITSPQESAPIWQTVRERENQDWNLCVKTRTVIRSPTKTPSAEFLHQRTATALNGALKILIGAKTVSSANFRSYHVSRGGGAVLHCLAL